MTRDELLQRGIARANRWCCLNNIVMPPVHVVETTGVNACAYYRPARIVISPKKCASPGYGGRAWSWPGYVIDRTPYGVVPHELGHHVDWVRGGSKGEWDASSFSYNVCKQACEPAITGYAPNIAEWWAEIFRLFVTNPDLLRNVRPRTYDIILKRCGLKPLDTKSWRSVLKGAPQRTLDMAAKKIAVAKKENARERWTQRDLSFV